jgi:hypothetical protein
MNHKYLRKKNGRDVKVGGDVDNDSRFNKQDNMFLIMKNKMRNNTKILNETINLLNKSK